MSRSEWFMKYVLAPMPFYFIVACLIAVSAITYYRELRPKPVVIPVPPVCNCVCPPPSLAECPHIP